MRLTKIISFGIVLSLTSACGSGNKNTPPAQTAGATSPLPDEENLKAIRSALLDPARLPHLMWRQKLTIRAQESTYHLEAIVQNDGEQFQVLALGPGSMKLFLVTHNAQGVKTQVFVDRKISLSPEYLLFDIQRSLFWVAPTACTTPQVSFDFRGFSVLDHCESGRTRLRRVSDGPAGSGQANSQLEVRYDPAFDFASPPQEITLRHAQRGYEIAIVQLESHTLP